MILIRTGRAGFLFLWLVLLVCLPWLLSQEQPLQVGYAVIRPAPGDSTPVVAGLFSLRNSEGVLVSEAGFEASAPLSEGRIFVDESGTRTGLALANISTEANRIEFTLRDELGRFQGSTVQDLRPGEHLPRFADELFPGLSENFVGSLTFRSENGEGRLGATTLRQSFNIQGEPILATLPVVIIRTEVTAAGLSPAPLIFPHIGAGEGLTTQLILINPGSEPSSGTIRFVSSQGTPLVVEVGELEDSEILFGLQPDGVFHITLTRQQGIAVGYAVVTPNPGDPQPAGTAIFQFRGAAGHLISEAGVASVTPTSAARIMVDTIGTQTGIAVANPGEDGRVIHFELLDDNGFTLGSVTRELAAEAHLAIFVHELFSDLPPAFGGLLQMSAVQPVAPITLKLSFNQRDDPILTTLPLADLNQPPPNGPLILAQLGLGTAPGLGLFLTRILMISTDLARPLVGNIVFFQSDGQPLVTPLLGENNSQFQYRIAPGGGRNLRPGVTAGPAQILFSSSGASFAELVVNRGNTKAARPFVVDADGNLRNDFEFSFLSLDPQSATVDEFGQIEGVSAGFSTLTVSTGGAVATAVITVVEVTAGAEGFEITGIAQDLAQRLYLASSTEHAILRSDDLEGEPEVFAGIRRRPGLRNSNRLNSLFNRPASLAIQQATGQLYVADAANHAIRTIDFESGVDTDVATLAGGQPGVRDGGLDEARFRNPRSLTIDGRGSLWVADTGNHTIRRIDLTAGTVETVAGRPGVAGFSEGTGTQALFSSPTAIALEPEPLARQQQRELRGEAPPPVTVLVADSGNGAIRRVREDGQTETLSAPFFRTVADSHPALGTAQATSGFVSLSGIAVDRTGNIFASDSETGQVIAILRIGSVTSALQEGVVTRPGGIAVTSSGRLVVADGVSTGVEIVYGTPEIDSVDPPQVPLGGGVQLVIEGRNFAPETVVVVGGVLVAGARILDSSRISLVAPELPSGRHLITLHHRGGIAQRPLVVLPIPLDQLQPGEITTFAGGTSFAGEGEPANQAQLAFPDGIALAGNGDLLVADTSNHRIRRVDAVTGLTFSVVGSGLEGFSPDGALAIASSLREPAGLALDRAGDLYFTDAARIRRVDARQGVIRTVAGGGFPADGVGDGGPASEARLDSGDLALDGRGNVYLADRFLHRVRRVDAMTGLITSVAGTGEQASTGDNGPATSATLNMPFGLAFDRTENLFIAEFLGRRIRRIDRESETIATVAGKSGFPGIGGEGGPATDALLGGPFDVAVDGSGNLFIADTDRVWRVDAASGIIEILAGGNGLGFSGDGDQAREARLNRPRSILLDGSSNIYICDTVNNRVRMIDARNGKIRTVAGGGGSLGDGGLAVAASFRVPSDIVFDLDGNVYISDRRNNRVRRVDAETGLVTTVAGTGEDGFGGDGGLASDALLSRPRGLAIDTDGNLLIADRANGRVRKVDHTTRLITTIAGGGFSPPDDGEPATEIRFSLVYDLAFGPEGNLYFSANHRVFRLDTDTGFISTVAGTGQTGFNGDDQSAPQANLSQPVGIAFDAQGNLYIADRNNHRIRRVDRQSGLITTVAGTGTAGFSGDGELAAEARLRAPEHIVLDPSGNLWISDTGNNVVRIVNSATGLISTAAGNLEFRFSGDGGSALEAALKRPGGMVLDSSGNLYLADQFNDRIRVVKGSLSPP